METSFATPFGEYSLRRMPRRRKEPLRAWDSADAYLLEHLAQTPHEGALAICNDGFGALCLPLFEYQPQVFSDSALSHAAILQNAEANGLPKPHLSTSLELPQGPLARVVLKVPKQLSFLEDQLLRLRPFLGPDSEVIAAGMVKWLTSSVWQLLQDCIGPTETRRAQKKARLIFARPTEALDQAPENPYPSSYVYEGFTFSNHSNVFSREKLDIGTRFLLEHLPRDTGAEDIVDLGCGNGILGIFAGQSHPDARLHFVDESFMALASAEQNAAPLDQPCAFYSSLDELASSSVDLVLCNPPFHHVHVVGDHLARLMFREAQRVLREEGRLVVVGNRHLGYHVTLKRHFEQVGLRGSNRKFVVLEASRPRA